LNSFFVVDHTIEFTTFKSMFEYALCKISVYQKSYNPFLDDLFNRTMKTIETENIPILDLYKRLDLDYDATIKEYGMNPNVLMVLLYLKSKVTDYIHQQIKLELESETID